MPLIRRLAWLPLLGVMLALAACGPRPADPGSGPPPAEIDAAEEALERYFTQLADGRYAQAAGLYGGSLDVLAGWNPSVPVTDAAQLWRNGCTINGLRCLKPRTISYTGSDEPGVLSFTVEFSTREGELFILGPCCGADETEMPPVSAFTYRVRASDSGDYEVLDMPPYQP